MQLRSLEFTISMKIIECPRDAMQGIHQHIPTKLKIEYLNSLLKVGFDTLDFGSFVSPKSIPQMADTKEVLAGLELDNTPTKLLAIVANLRGVNEACQYPEIQYLGYPFSISETFQTKNTNRGINEAWDDIKKIHQIVEQHQKELVVYLSMGFGNPYNDPWSVDLVEEWTEKFSKLGVRILSLADTVGTAHPEDISYLFKRLTSKYPNIEFGAHFHSKPTKWREKISAAYNNGCHRFDAAIKGYGGCPMVDDGGLTGNIATENLLTYFDDKNQQTNINIEAFGNSVLISSRVFAYAEE